MRVEIVSCKEYHFLQGQEERCSLAALVHQGRETVKAWGGKLVLVWDSIRSPPLDGLEALVTQSPGQEVPMEVITVGYTLGFFHPVIVNRLLKSGGGLRRADTWVQALHTIHHPSFIPWGIGASIRLLGTSGVRVVSARGRGVTMKGGIVKVPCLEGVPTVALQLSMDLGSCPLLSNTDDDRIHIQLEL
ncbi:hypothetical protein Pcinc_031136 [Petrolisthes cinctipes]|uniref:Uncharacterized protein n=1 Tax=Petrolisthes cinctipes TaxID=88211 RepID=A0AAE1K5A2_PETCI|nr:hypothetical protein Pcinc_031136 [Petrolisthes cinctipes]